MRAVITTTIALAALLAVSTASGTASAAGGDGKEAGKGSSGPAAAASGSSPTGGGTEAPSDSRNIDRAQTTDATKKVWEVGASYEFHRLVASQDTAAVKNLSYIGVYARWDVTPYDRIVLRGGAYEQFLVSTQGPPAILIDDVNLSYTRRFPLLGGVNLRLTGALSAPTSRASRLASLYVAPRLALQADRRFGHFTLDARVSGSYYIVHCASVGTSDANPYDCSNPSGGSPNAQAFVGATVAGDFSMPFHEALSVGASVFTGYLFLHDVYGTPGQNMSTSGGMMPANAAYHQPTQQSYGAEVYVRYGFPSLGGFKTDLSVAFANGDPTMGYGSVLHDGVQHVYGSFRQTAEVYAVLGARY